MKPDDVRDLAVPVLAHRIILDPESEFAGVRAEDIVSRYGGEEFTLILPETDLVAARECATRLQMASRGIQVQHYGETLEGIRLSIGIACYPQSGTTAESVLRAADSALYRAKERGRDQIYISEER